LTADGHPRAVFDRAIERGNLPVAEATLRELGRPSLVELLELTALIAQKDPRRHGRVATRWLQRYLEARVDATIEEALLIAAALQQLGGHAHGVALAALRAMAEAASSERRSRRTA
jgi:hypothetical protein